MNVRQHLKLIMLSGLFFETLTPPKSTAADTTNHDATARASDDDGSVSGSDRSSLEADMAAGSDAGRSSRRSGRSDAVWSLLEANMSSPREHLRNALAVQRNRASSASTPRTIEHDLHMGLGLIERGSAAALQAERARTRELEARLKLAEVQNSNAELRRRLRELKRQLEQAQHSETVAEAEKRVAEAQTEVDSAKAEAERSAAERIAAIEAKAKAERNAEECRLVTLQAANAAVAEKQRLQHSVTLSARLDIAAANQRAAAAERGAEERVRQSEAEAAARATEVEGRAMQAQVSAEGYAALVKAEAEKRVAQAEAEVQRLTEERDAVSAKAQEVEVLRKQLSEARAEVERAKADVAAATSKAKAEVDSAKAEVERAKSDAAIVAKNAQTDAESAKQLRAQLTAAQSEVKQLRLSNKPLHIASIMNRDEFRLTGLLLDYLTNHRWRCPEEYVKLLGIRAALVRSTLFIDELSKTSDNPQLRSMQPYLCSVLRNVIPKALLLNAPQCAECIKKGMRDAFLSAEFRELKALCAEVNRAYCQRINALRTTLTPNTILGALYCNPYNAAADQPYTQTQQALAGKVITDQRITDPVKFKAEVDAASARRQIMDNQYASRTQVINDILSKTTESSMSKVIEVLMRDMAMRGMPRNFAESCYDAIETFLIDKRHSTDCMMRREVFVAEAVTAVAARSHNSVIEKTVAFDIIRNTSPELRLEVASAILRSARSVEVYDMLQEFLANPTGAPQPSGNSSGLLRLGW